MTLNIFFNNENINLVLFSLLKQIMGNGYFGDAMKCKCKYSIFDKNPDNNIFIAGIIKK